MSAAHSRVGQGSRGRAFAALLALLLLPGALAGGALVLLALFVPFADLGWDPAAESVFVTVTLVCVGPLFLVLGRGVFVAVEVARGGDRPPLLPWRGFRGLAAVYAFPAAAAVAWAAVGLALGVHAPHITTALGVLAAAGWLTMLTSLLRRREQGPGIDR